MDNSDIMHFAPKSWNKYEVGEFDVPRGSAEFSEVENDLLKAVRRSRRVISLTRYQNVYDFGQFLMRSQILVISKDTPIYKVRRYVAIPNHQRDIAVKHNLDHRRLNIDEIGFQSHLTDGFSKNDLIFVVQILSDDPHRRKIYPYNFTEYYIDYIAEMEYF